MTTSDYAKLHPNCQQTLQYDFETRSTSPVFILATTRFNVQPNEDDPLEEAPCFDVGEDQRTPPGQLFKCLFFGREIRSRVTWVVRDWALLSAGMTTDGLIYIYNWEGLNHSCLFTWNMILCEHRFPNARFSSTFIMFQLHFVPNPFLRSASCSMTCVRLRARGCAPTSHRFCLFFHFFAPWDREKISLELRFSNRHVIFGGTSFVAMGVWSNWLQLLRTGITQKSHELKYFILVMWLGHGYFDCTLAFRPWRKRQKETNKFRLFDVSMSICPLWSLLNNMRR